MAEAINAYFVSVSQDLPPADPNFLDQLQHDMDVYKFLIEPHEVAARLAKLNTYKAPGPDGLPTWLLKDCVAYLVRVAP